MDFVDDNKAQEVKKKRGKPFERGTSGNPEGKRPGTRNAATLANEALIEGQSEAVIQIVIEKALAGDMAAIRLLFDRIVPVRRERPVQFEMPQLKTVEDAASAIARIFEGVGQGQLSESEARTLNSLVDTFLETRAHVDLEQRLKKLEEIKSSIEEKALEVREHHMNRFQGDFTKRLDK